MILGCNKRRGTRVARAKAVANSGAKQHVTFRGAGTSVTVPGTRGAPAGSRLGRGLVTPGIGSRDGPRLGRGPGPNVIKLFTFVVYVFFVIS